MKRILLLLFCFYHYYYSNAIIAPALTFGLNKGVSGGTMGITPGNQGAVVIDANGNSYVGFSSDRGLTFNAAVTFPAVSVETAYVVKFSPTGVALTGISSYPSASPIQSHFVDIRSMAVYGDRLFVGGEFLDSNTNFLGNADGHSNNVTLVAFDTGGSVMRNGFIVCLNTTNNLYALWGAVNGKPSAFTGDSNVMAVAYDPVNDYVYTAGYHTDVGTLSFRPAGYNQATASMSCADLSSGFPNDDTYLAQYVGSTGVLRAIMCQTSGTGNDRFYAMNIDSVGRVYLVGSTSSDDTLAWDGFTPSPSLDSGDSSTVDAFVLSIDKTLQTGNKLYAKWSFKASADPNGDEEISAVVLDSNGNLYLSYFLGGVSANPLTLALGDQTFTPAMCRTRFSTDGARMLDLTSGSYTSLKGAVLAKISNTAGSNSAPANSAVKWIVHLCGQAVTPASGSSIAIDSSSNSLYVASSQTTYEWSTIATLNRNSGGVAYKNITGCCGGTNFGASSTGIHKFDMNTGLPLFSYGFAGGGFFTDPSYFDLVAYQGLAVHPTQGGGQVVFTGSFQTSSAKPSIFPKFSYSGSDRPTLSPAFEGLPASVSFSPTSGANSNFYMIGFNDYCATQAGTTACLNGGTCNNTAGTANGFTCMCAAGYSGLLCQTNINECSSIPCQNGGTCNDLLNSFSCACVTGYCGVLCQTNIDDCSSVPCKNAATCVDRDAGGGFDCICASGYSGVICQTEINECSSSPCRSPGTSICIDQVNAFYCQCNAGYSGVFCSTEINECFSNPCQSPGMVSCTDQVNAFYCNCKPGYSGIYCQTEINECASSPCRSPGTNQCLDQINAWYCQCNAGYSGIYCRTNINECASNPCRSPGTSQCLDQINAWYCQCNAGYSGLSCQSEINECSSSPCRSPGFTSCTDQINAFYCNCNAGYSGVYCQTEINECSSAPCTNGGTCVDHTNDFTCICLSGYSGLLCQTNINECVSTPCQNGGTCIDHINFFSCQCHPGYSGILCETELRECASYPCQNGGSCTDGIDSFVCFCMDGFNGTLCQTEVNECLSFPCQNDGTCVDVVNGFSCLCSSDWEGLICETFIPPPPPVVAPPPSETSTAGTLSNEETTTAASNTDTTPEPQNTASGTFQRTASVVIPVTVVSVAVAVSIAITAAASTAVGTAAGTVGAGVGASSAAASAASSSAATASLASGAGHPFSRETSPLLTRHSTTPPPSSDGIELSKKQQNLFEPTPSLV